MRIQAFTALGALAVSTVASAHSLTDHRMITNHAITEFNLCFNGVLSGGTEDMLQESVREEDTNLVKKWALYSHFYHPHKELSDLSRLDSSMRIALLQKEISQALGVDDIETFAEAYDELGHSIHHIQDMTSPPHVVPVMHGLFDGFEGYEVSAMDYPDIRLEGPHCQRLLQNKKPMGLYQILRETAAHTLTVIDQPVSIRNNGEPMQITWRDWYWKESPERKFGEYGVLGNEFGNTRISYGNLAEIRVERATYLNFKRARLREAIDRTLEALVWFYFHN